MARKGILQTASIAALVASIVVSVALWGKQDDNIFNGMLKADEFAIFHGRATLVTYRNIQKSHSTQFHQRFFV